MRFSKYYLEAILLRIILARSGIKNDLSIVFFFHFDQSYSSGFFLFFLIFNNILWGKIKSLKRTMTSICSSPRSPISFSFLNSIREQNQELINSNKNEILHITTIFYLIINMLLCLFHRSKCSNELRYSLTSKKTMISPRKTRHKMEGISAVNETVYILPQIIAIKRRTKL